MAFARVLSLRPTDPLFAKLLDDLVQGADPILQARAENHLFEERVGADRQQGYDAVLRLPSASVENWIEKHREYLNGKVQFQDLPETFTALNAEAALPAAVLSDLGEVQELVRVESLDYALSTAKGTAIDSLHECVSVFRGDAKIPNLAKRDAEAKLHEICRLLNENPYAVRPRFAAFAQDLEEDLAADDWLVRLRDRLGLAHFPAPHGRFGAHPLAVMRYQVKLVRTEAERRNATHPLTVPTVIDAEPNEVFHPAPRELHYGRTLNLGGPDADCERLASEVLHLKVRYQPRHIWRVGAISERADDSPGQVARLRAHHLGCLRRLSGRDDYGLLGAPSP